MLILPLLMVLFAGDLTPPFVDAPAALPAVPLPAVPLPAVPREAPPREAPGSIPVAELHARRDALAKAVGTGLVLVEARGSEYDAVTRDFFYLTGLETVGAVLVLPVVDGAGSPILYLPPRSRSWERWNGPREYPGPEAAARTGIEDVRSLAAWTAEFEEWLAKSKRVHHLPTESPRPELASPDQLWARALRERHPEIEDVIDLGRALHPLRQVKGPDEIERLRRAIAITGAALRAGIGVCGPGRHEFEIEAAIEAAFRSHGSEHPGFDSIVGSGPNSCVLHYQRNQGRVSDGDLIVIDVGASWGGYTADITRTVPISGRYSERQREVYDVVFRAQAAGIEAVKPGATLRDVHRAARAVTAAAGLAEHYLHGTSHHVGLDVHDVGPSRPLQPGMVITVEPGLYLPEEGFGIRIEDMVRVTQDGCEVLSRGIPKDPETLESWVGSAN